LEIGPERRFSVGFSAVGNASDEAGDTLGDSARQQMREDKGSFETGEGVETHDGGKSKLETNSNDMK
jgi:hypothetical protein